MADSSYKKATWVFLKASLLASGLAPGAVMLGPLIWRERVLVPAVGATQIYEYAAMKYCQKLLNIKSYKMCNYNAFVICPFPLPVVIQFPNFGEIKQYKKSMVVFRDFPYV